MLLCLDLNEISWINTDRTEEKPQSRDELVLPLLWATVAMCEQFKNTIQSLQVCRQRPLDI